MVASGDSPRRGGIYLRRVHSHGVVTVNTDAFEKSDSTRTDLTIPFLQKYLLMSLSTTQKARSPDFIGATKQPQKGGNSEPSSLRVVDQSWYIRTKYGYELVKC